MLRASCVIAVLASLASASVLTGQELPLVPAQECRARQGLPHFFSKARTTGATLTVAYLGGSITAQQGWRPKSLSLFQETWPQAIFKEVNAAIGGTGSDLGVFRLHQDVLVHKPDLLFVEFAVNDGGASTQQILRCMEGIVRQTWQALPECDIAFVYTLTEALATPMIEGHFQRSASAMEKIADHYGIPTIHLGMEVARLAREGNLIWRARLPKTEEEKKMHAGKLIFAPDSVHPHVETGHELYLEAIRRSLPVIESASGQPKVHRLGQPYVADHYQAAKMLPISQAHLSSGFARLDPETDAFGKRWAKRLMDLHHCGTSGETVEFKFKGTRCALFDVIGPDCGQVVITLDDQAPKLVPRFDAYCTYHRLSTLLIGSDLEDTLHTVKIEIHPQQPDKPAILARNKNVMDKPERFDATFFYPGALLLVGELVK